MSTTAVKNETPTACHERQITRRTLKYVNKIRAELGLKPVKFLAKGITGEASACSIAATLITKYTDAEVSSSGISVERWSRVRGLSGDVRGDIVQRIERRDLPGYVMRFIEKFDKGHFPGLMAD